MTTPYGDSPYFYMKEFAYISNRTHRQQASRNRAGWYTTYENGFTCKLYRMLINWVCHRNQVDGHPRPKPWFNLFHACFAPLGVLLTKLIRFMVLIPCSALRLAKPFSHDWIRADKKSMNRNGSEHPGQKGHPVR